MQEFDQLDLTGNQLVLFLSVYDNNSVSQAAAELGVNQSTVSYGLDRLRNALDDPLFVKSGRGIVPTDRATLLAPLVRSLVDGFDGLTEPRAYSPADDGRQITIAANVMELLPLLKSLHFELGQKAPNSQFKFLELGSRDNTKDLLDQNVVDVVLSVRTRNLSNSLSAKTVYRSEIVCFYDAQMRGPVNSMVDFAAAEHATMDFGGSAKSTIDQLLEQESLERTIKLRVPNAFALGDLMKGTRLVASMQRSLKDSALAGLSYSPHPLSVPEAVFDMVWHKKHENSQRSIWLRQVIENSFKLADENLQPLVGAAKLQAEPGNHSLAATRAVV